MLSPRGKPEHKVSRRVGYNICGRNDRGRANDGNFVTKKDSCRNQSPGSTPVRPGRSSSFGSMSHRVNESRREMRPVKAAIHAPAAPDIPSSSEIDLGASEPRGGHEWLWHLGRRTHWQIGSDRMASQSSAIPEPVGRIAERHPRIFASGFGGFKNLTREGRVARKPLLEGIPMNNHAPA